MLPIWNAKFPAYFGQSRRSRLLEPATKSLAIHRNRYEKDAFRRCAVMQEESATVIADGQTSRDRLEKMRNDHAFHGQPRCALIERSQYAYIAVHETGNIESAAGSRDRPVVDVIP